MYKYFPTINNSKIHPTAIIFAQEVYIADDVMIGPNTIIAGDTIYLGTGVRIEGESDIRASSIKIDKNSEIGKNAKILVAEEFHVGKASRLCRGIEITCRSFVTGNLLFLGHNLCVGYGGTLESTSNVSMGDRVALGPNSILNANNAIILEDQVGSGCNLSIWTHGYHFGHSILDGFPVSFDPIYIRKNVWLGFHVTLLPGVTIGENTIVAAGSVVTKALPDNCLAAGIPASPKKDLKPQALPIDLQDKITLDILAKWRDELQWKGIQVNQDNNDFYTKKEIIVNTGQSKKLTRIIFWSNNIPLSIDTDFNTEIIVISVQERKAFKEHIPPNLTLFELSSRQFSGLSTPLAEDLRNHLRRHGIQCGEERVFQSINPKPFDKLKFNFSCNL